MPALLTGTLTVEFVAALNAPVLEPWIESFAAILLMVHALLTLRRLSMRQRPLTDATVWFWRLGMGALAAAMLLLVVGNLTDLSTSLTMVLYVLYTSFALSVVLAMAYKIVPFLTWFHLNAQGYFTAPMMHEVIHPQNAKRHLALHSTTVFVALVAAFDPRLWPLAGSLLCASFAWIAVNIYRAWHLYLHVQKTGERFDMGSFS